MMTSSTSKSTATSSPPRTRIDALPVLVALVLMLVPAGRAHAQGAASSGAAADKSWFARYHPVARDTLPPDTYTGWTQFQANCSRCHGQDAEGSSFAPSLVQALGPDGPVKTEAAFLTIACNGVPGTGMPAWCKLGLGEDKLRRIYLYVHGRATGAIHPGRPMEQ
jgi:mono/diheme cytochrome c family protein